LTSCDARFEDSREGGGAPVVVFSEHDHGKYAVNWHGKMVVVAAVAQVTGAVSTEWLAGLIIRWP
jgi:hypothetical protein